MISSLDVCAMRTSNLDRHSLLLEHCLKPKARCKRLHRREDTAHPPCEDDILLHFTSLHFIEARAGQRTPAALSDSYTGPYMRQNSLIGAHPATRSTSVERGPTSPTQLRGLALLKGLHLRARPFAACCAPAPSSVPPCSRFAQPTSVEPARDARETGVSPRQPRPTAPGDVAVPPPHTHCRPARVPHERVAQRAPQPHAHHSRHTGHRLRGASTCWGALLPFGALRALRLLSFLPYASPSQGQGSMVCSVWDGATAPEVVPHVPPT